MIPCYHLCKDFAWSTNFSHILASLVESRKVLPSLAKGREERGEAIGVIEVIEIDRWLRNIWNNILLRSLFSCSFIWLSLLIIYIIIHHLGYRHYFQRWMTMKGRSRGGGSGEISPHRNRKNFVVENGVISEGSGFRKNSSRIIKNSIIQ